MDDLIKRIDTLVKALDKARYTDTFQIDDFKMKQVGYGDRDTILEAPDEWETFHGGSHWGGKDYHCCFKTYITIPQVFHEKEVVINLKTGAADIWDTDNPQFIAYIDGSMICAMDMNHHEMVLSECAEAGTTYEVGLYAYSNSLSPSIILNLRASVIHRDVEKLYYDIKVPFEAVSLQREDCLDRIHTICILAETVNKIDFRRVGSESFYQSVLEADQYLHNYYYENICGKQDVTVHSIGHTHIDVAWKWPLRQTREKAIRSFKTVLHLMERYPEYKFMSSQPQLYEFVKEDCPEVYAQICSRIAESRWETEGAMWLAADCNLVSGESLVRQILYGKRFFHQEFGKGDNLVLWLPDVFGYSAALPQILIKSGIKYFMTTKIAWNEYNQIPNDIMMWKGIDGTEVLTYFITTRNYEPYPELNKNAEISTTYNGRQNANQIMGTWQRFQNKDILQEVLTCYGFGDGGGGTTAEMLEESRRLEKGIPGCPMVKQTFVKEFFQLIDQELKGKKIPKWCGELYLEFHRGTYTSMARNKRYNRLCEFLNQDVELFSIMDLVNGGTRSYPVHELKKIWKLTLLNQFHDILPGSSIKEVYEDSKQQYEEILTLDRKLIDQSLKNICDSMKAQSEDSYPVLIVWNQTGFTRDSIAEFSMEELGKEPQEFEYEVLQDDKLVPLQKTVQGNFLLFIKQIPSKGYRTLKLQKKQKSKASIGEKNCDANSKKIIIKELQTIDTPFYSIRLNKDGEFVSLYDKESERELIQKGRNANQLIVYEDRPAEYDAWNIDSTYTEKSWIVSNLKCIAISENGPVRTCINIVRKFMESTIEQDIILYTKSKRIDFKTEVDWRESQLLLKVAFPLDIMTEKAVYEIQYGNVERPTHRNTSWEKAKFEVCAHKWADLSEDGYGVALLNDCKYGYDINESVMRLTLIKSGVFPNPDADQELHQFTYSLLPHMGDFREGRVIQEAYDLNCPVYTKLLAKGKHSASNQVWSMLEVDKKNVMIDVVKKAEDSEDIILRIYEAYGRRCKVNVKLIHFQYHDITECNLMEQEYAEKNFEWKDGSLAFIIKPYEIKTFRIHT
ncbi:alpha-mannosidase [Anaerocolumna sedimenticola]|uniref:Alpha-mannosidase n=1 Tax=Anaerocolumna sedimenticola TaxID=2696063 RepID=A0A6P1THQ6_9FIRM|nr:alpha-mannosidase [Anaerocolumna sedimenticola]QHQ59827.1 alpha-mannosidase [Anaerocolumna sedimenticola]